MSLLKCYKLYFSFKAFIAIYRFLFLFVFICLTFEGRRRGERKRGQESRHRLLRKLQEKANAGKTLRSELWSGSEG